MCVYSCVCVFVHKRTHNAIVLNFYSYMRVYTYNLRTYFFIFKRNIT